MTRRRFVSQRWRGAGMALLALAVGACTKGAPEVMIPNVTHVNGVPIAEYKPKKSDRRKDMVFTVATPAPVAETATPATPAAPAASAVPAAPAVPVAPAVPAAPETPPATTAAATVPATVATATAGTAATASAGGSALPGLIAPIVGVATPVIVSAIDLAPDGDVLSTLVQTDGQKLRVSLVDRATRRVFGAQIDRQPPPGAAEVHVSGLGPNGDFNTAIHAYVTVCDVNADSVARWVQQPGVTSRTSDGFVLDTDVCPGLWKFAFFNR